jgi:hypothetical protein
VVRQAPLLVPPVVLIWILAGLGRGLGLPLLFWRTTYGETPEKATARLVVGLFAGIFLGVSCFLVALSEGTDRHMDPRTLTAIVVAEELACAAAVLSIAVRRGERLRLPIGVVSGLAFVGAIVGWGPRLIPEAFRSNLVVRWFLDGPLRTREPAGALEDAHLLAIALSVLGVFVYVVLYTLNRWWRWRIYPGAAICVLLTVMAAAQCFSGMRTRAGQPAVMALLVLLYALLNSRWQRAEARGLPGTGNGAARALLDDERCIEAWREGLPGNDKPRLVVVAADGGGIRAALWAATVLTTIARRWPSFGRHVRLITGASGGMLGATYWTATLDAGGKHWESGIPLTSDTLVDHVAAGGLSAVTSGLVFRDLLPPPFRQRQRDRGTLLEEAWETNCRALARAFESLAAGEAEGWRPSLVLSPMVVEDGRRLVFSNLDLSPLLKTPDSTSGYQAFEKWPSAWKDLHLSTAVRLQANFPWVLPSTEVPPIRDGGPRLRVVDAGYYDETGVDLACLWIHQRLDCLTRNADGILLLQLRDTPSINRKLEPTQSRSWLRRGLDGLGTPVSAVLRARDSTSWYRNDATVAALAERLSETKASDFFTTEVLELSQDASLSWSLTPGEVRIIRGDVDGDVNRTTIDRIVAWGA